MIQDLDITSEEYDFEYDKINRVGKIDGNEQNAIVCFCSHQFPAELYYIIEKESKTKELSWNGHLLKPEQNSCGHFLAKPLIMKKSTFATLALMEI